MPVIRLAKIAMTAMLAAFTFIVTYDNLIDYDSNYEFVKHVLSMDTTFPNNALKSRAITNPEIWKLGYAGIIAAEGLTCLLFAVGTIAMLRTVGSPPEIFNRSKVWMIAGSTMGFGVWFFGFMIVGGEYFAMWQSQTWNGQEAAFRFYMAILGVLIFVCQPDAERG